MKKDKSESFEMFKARKTLVENQSDCKLKMFESNNDSEFVFREFLDLCKLTGI